LLAIAKDFCCVGFAGRHHDATPARPDGPGAAAPPIKGGARRRHTRMLLQPNYSAVAIAEAKQKASGWLAGRWRLLVEACWMLQCLCDWSCVKASFAADRDRPECSERPQPKTMTVLSTRRAKQLRHEVKWSDFTALGWHVFLMARERDRTPFFLILTAERNGAGN